jgi:glycosyltransferase involved in cell wall biosynthesis
MKILMLTPYLPYPLYSGGQIRTYNLLKNLAKKHQITLVSFYRQDNELKYIKELEKYCRKVIPIKRRQTWGLTNILLSGFSFYPFLVCTYISPEAKRAVEKELFAGHYDLIHVETFYLMPNLPPKTPTPILLVEQTIEYLVYQRYVQNLRFKLAKPLLYLDVLKIKLWEKYFWRQAGFLAAMSSNDLDIMLSAVLDKAGAVVANGVDMDFFNQVKKIKSVWPTVLFVGNFKWLPNKDAASYLTESIWPKIKKAVPRAKLWIVGRNPSQKIQAYNQLKDIKVDDNIEDIRQALSKATVLLAPIRNGRGTKYKVLEAMAAGVPVVTTPLGSQGIQAVDGQQILIARNIS